MNVIVDKDKLDGLADAIGIKSKVRLPLTIDEQIEAVNLIETEPKLQDKQVTLTPKATSQTKTVMADDGYDGLGEVAVNVKEAPLKNYNRGYLTSSGPYTFIPSSPYIGYSSVSFNVPTSSQTRAINVGFTTQNNARKWRVRPYTNTTTEGWVNTGYAYGGYTYYDALPTGTTVTPSSTAQTIGGANVMMEGAVTVEAVPSGSLGIPSWNHSKTDSSYHISVSYPNITAGYISNAGVVSMNLTLEDKTATPSTSSQTIVPTNDTRYLNSVTVDPIPSEYIIPSGTKQITANGTGIDVTQYAEVDVAVPSSQPNLQTKTKSYTPSETAQSETVSADVGYDGLDQVSVSVGAISSTYVGSGITRRDSSDLTASGATVSVPSGYYESNESKTVASGTAGTPALTVSAVENHTKTIRSSVINQTGWITGGTVSGASTTVSANDLVSGTINITSSGNTDVTNYATASVASGSATASATKGTVSNHSVTITPSVTRTAGYITAGTASGTAVTVSASELVSGSETKTSNGTYDVTNLAELIVNVSGGGSLTVKTATHTQTATGQTISFTSLSGEPKYWFCRITSQLSSSGSTTYYYIVDCFYDGTSVKGNSFRIGSTRRIYNVTSGITQSYSNGTLTITGGSATGSAPGQFYGASGISYELVYIY